MLAQEFADRLPARFPYTCQWEITWRCNLRCVMCYTDCFNHADLVNQELPTEEVHRILDELADAGCVELCFTGGEPFARADFIDIYGYAILKGFLVTIFSNGTLITEAVADRLAQSPPYRIEISLHGLTPQTFDRVTQGRGSYDRCMAAIERLRARQVPLVLKATALSLNKNEILPIKQYVEGHGSIPFKLGEEMRPGLDGDRAPMDWGLSEEELAELNRQDPQLWQEACQRAAQEPPACRSGMRSFHIDPCGRLQLCSGNRRESYDLRTGSFEEGFYHHLPSFPCSYQSPGAPSLVQVERHHA